MTALARDLRTLVMADKPGQLLSLKPLIDPGQFGARDEAHLAVMKVVLDAIFAVPSLGSPSVVEDDDGRTIVRSGYFIAPLGKIVTHEDSRQQLFASGAAAEAAAAPLDEYRDFQMAVNGFIDLRPHAIVSSAKLPAEGAVSVHRDEESYRVRPHRHPASPARARRDARAGAHGPRHHAGLALWNMQRDARGHTYVVPGVVEALRMAAEGQEKTTGTEWLDGMWATSGACPRSAQRRSWRPWRDESNKLSDKNSPSPSCSPSA